MTVDNAARVTVLGLGLMGRALARTLAEAGHSVTVWNRTPGRAAALAEHGVTEAANPAAAIEASELVVAALFDHASVHDALDAHAGSLSGRTLVNLTTTTPNQARELARWAEAAGADYLDGGMMAVPDMIGRPGSSILYSGSRAAHERYSPLLGLWGDDPYFGEDAGLASLWDLALLSGMYFMFAGFFHGAAMVAAEGVPVAEFAKRAEPWLRAMTAAVPLHAAKIDSGDYTTDAQSLDFNNLDDLVRASADQGVDTRAIASINTLIGEQIAAGHGAEAFERVFESFKHPGRF